MPRATKSPRSEAPSSAERSRNGASAASATKTPRPKRSPDGKKWIGGEPDDDWLVLARRMLAGRLHAVRSALSPAARKWDEDLTYVHQLRVATRRAGAALTAAADALPKNKRRKVARRLKKIRRAAGEARDLDVLIARWRADAKRAAALSALGLLDDLEEQRREAQRPLRRADTRKWHRRFAKVIARLARRLQLEPEAPATLRLQAQAQLARLTQEFFDAPAADAADNDSLHELRIRAKRLRYSMEIFAAGLPAAFREELYPQIEELQELLGRVNDHAVAVERLCLWSSKAEAKQHADFGRLIDLEMSDLEQAKRRFSRFWSASRRDALRQSFDKFLVVSC